MDHRRREQLGEPPTLYMVVTSNALYSNALYSWVTTECAEVQAIPSEALGGLAIEAGIRLS